MIGVEACGTQLICNTEQALPDSGLVLYVGGVDRADLLAPSTLQWTQVLRAQGAASFMLRDTSQSVRIKPGYEVRLFRDGVLLFAGSVERVSEDTPGGQTDRVTEIIVEAVDWNYLPERYYVADAYENLTQGAIVREILSETGLAEDGVTSANVADGITVDRLSANYRKCAAVLDDVARLTDLVWYIDYWKDFHLEAKGTCSSPHNYGSNNRGYISSYYAQDRRDYANRVIMRAGKDRTSEIQIEKFDGDSDNRTFTLSLEVAEKPVIKVDTGGGLTAVPPADIGVRGVDEEYDENDNPTNFEWFYAVEEKEINQASHQTVLATGDTLQVEYTGLFPIILQADSDLEQDSRRAIEGGSGRYELVADEKTIDGRANALERAQGILDSVDEIDQPLSFSTFDTGFQVGQQMVVDLPEHNASGSWTIERVQVRDRGDYEFRTELALTAVGRTSNFVDFWRRLEEQGREFVVRENEKLLLLKKGRETFQLTESTALVQADDLDPFGDDVASYFLIGNAIGSPIRNQDP